MSPTASTREILKGNAVGGPIPSRDGKKEKNNMPAVMDKIIDCWVFILILPIFPYHSLYYSPFLFLPNTKGIRKKE
jgi:hypothetical protein